VVALAQAMTEADMRALVRGDIRGEIWTKMIDGLCWNPVAVLTGATLGAIADRPEIVAIVRRMMTEAEAVANALGVVLPQPMEKRIAVMLAACEHRMSMLQDLTRSRPLEIDVLACFIAEMAAWSPHDADHRHASRPCALARHSRSLIRTPTPPLPTDRRYRRPDPRDRGSTVVGGVLM
jgi:hypothetical protein